VVVKTGVALPDELYERLMQLARAMGYVSLSKLIRDAVELFIAFNSWWGSRSPVKGFILVLAKQEAIGQLAALLHELGVKRYMVEEYGGGAVLLLAHVEGRPEAVKEIYKTLTRARGVLTVQSMVLPLPGGR
jgi:CopG family nickel-responsive transcriptional regulator